jgi:hypothetical protein
MGLNIMRDKSPKFQDPSDEFIEAFTGGGSPSATCEFCGRFNYGNDQIDRFSEEIPDLQDKANADLEHLHYVFHDYDCVVHGEIDGVTFVADCPCNKARKYEDFIWRHRRQILAYLKNRSELVLHEAKTLSREVERVEMASIKE